MKQFLLCLFVCLMALSVAFPVSANDDGCDPLPPPALTLDDDGCDPLTPPALAFDDDGCDPLPPPVLALN